MNPINPLAAIHTTAAAERAPQPPQALRATSAATPAGGQELRDVFTQFVGQSMFGQMLSAMRKTVDKPAYFHGGQAEEIFQGQLDQVLVEEITEASADQIADPMFELFKLGRPG